MVNTVGRELYLRTRDALCDLALDPVEVGLLWVIDLQPGLTQIAYAHILRRDDTTFGRLARALEDRGLIKRRETGDARARHLELTAAGEAALARAKVCVRRVERAVTARGNADDKAVAVRYLAGIV
ncbi:MAG: MarR family winged helix-turn-helix transcriptional regulator [Rhodospirillaceae bacterium]|nr:MarR family winged helix-turn-helix transcriptional regulator [Rhodospirillaceae bacterium]